MYLQYCKQKQRETFIENVFISSGLIVYISKIIICYEYNFFQSKYFKCRDYTRFCGSDYDIDDYYPKPDCIEIISPNKLLNIGFAPSVIMLSCSKLYILDLYNPTHDLIKNHHDHKKKYYDDATCIAIIPPQSLDQNICIAIGSHDTTITIFDLKLKKVLCILKGHSRSINCLVSLSTPTIENKLLISGSSDHTLKLWNVMSGQYRTLEGHKYSVNCVAILPYESKHLIKMGSKSHKDEIYAVSGSDDDTSIKKKWNGI